MGAGFDKRDYLFFDDDEDFTTSSHSPVMQKTRLGVDEVGFGSCSYSSQIQDVWFEVAERAQAYGLLKKGCTVDFIRFLHTYNNNIR